MIVMTIIRYAGGFPGLWESIVDSGVIANFQTLFNLITAIVLLPFTNVLVKIACKIIKDDAVEAEDVYPELAVLDEKLMVSPTVALGEVAKFATTMAIMAKENLELSLAQFEKYSTKRSEQIRATEDKLDFFTDSADNYMIKLTSNIETEKDQRERSMLMQCIRDVERIGDYSTDFNQIAEKMHNEEVKFSTSAQKELGILTDAVFEILRLMVEALESDGEYVARRIEPLEEVIDDMVLLLKNRHTERLCKNVCSVQSGLHFMNMLTYFECTADQCSSIAMLILGRNNEDIMKNHHAYLHELHESTDQSYLAEQENRRTQYFVPLENIKA